MLVAHVEQDGVWLIEGGMHRLAIALAALVTQRGARIRYGTEVSEILVERGRAVGLRLASGEELRADQIVFNGDAAALGDERFGRPAARAVPPMPAAQRSLSAVTWAMVAQVEGFPLLRHNVFFSHAYAAEFADIFQHGRLPAAPTVYACAQDRDDRGLSTQHHGNERLLCLINAPATGDARRFRTEELQQCEEATFGLMERCGLRLKRTSANTALTTPTDFEQLFPGTGGALYGRASHGWRASFQRPRARSRIPGLYLAGGSIHPGPGLPMAALSGRMAAAALIADRASTDRSRPVAMRGGMSTP
jgi:1-hydroxycarotenoid 3,4-desaturase